MTKCIISMNYTPVYIISEDKDMFVIENNKVKIYNMKFQGRI